MESEVRQQLSDGHLSPDNLSLAEMFIEAYGWHNFQQARKNGPNGPASTMATSIMEAAGGVTSAAFANITGQVIYNRLMAGYKNEDFVFTKLIPEYQTEFTFEKLAKVTPIGDKALSRGEAEAYAIAGVSQDWIHGPATEDRGLIVPVTWEAIFFDRTGMVTKEASDVGHGYGLNREKRATDVVIDENAGAKSAALGGHRYHWRDVDIGATYADNSGSHNWDNLSATTALVDWTSVDAVVQLANQVLDPNTSEPVAVECKHLVVPKSLEQAAKRIIHATDVRVTTPGFNTSGNPSQTTAPNPFKDAFEVITSRYLYARMATKTNWFLGDISKAFLYFVNRKMDTQQAPTNNQDEFNRRVVLQWRVSEHGNYGTVDPRMCFKATA